MSQPLIQSIGQPTQQQIIDALAERGLHPEDNYSFDNEFVSVTDVEGDNVLLGEDGKLYFIDPIIKFKKSAKEVLESLPPYSTLPKSTTTKKQALAEKVKIVEHPTANHQSSLQGNGYR